MSLETIDALRGLVVPEQGRVLARLASSVDPEHAIVEIGSFEGKSTCYLAYGAELTNGAHVWAIDPWDHPKHQPGKHDYNSPDRFAAFQRNLRSVFTDPDSRVTPIRGFSTEVASTWDGPEIGLLFIDGDHRFPQVYNDWAAFYPHLATHAVVVFDDLDTPKNPGVRVSVDRILEALHVANIPHTFHVEAERLGILTT